MGSVRLTEMSQLMVSKPTQPHILIKATACLTCKLLANCIWKKKQQIVILQHVLRLIWFHRSHEANAA